jgi:LuxR family transcriptional regulator
MRCEVKSRFNSVQQTQELCDLLTEETQLIGYDCFALCIRYPVPFTRPKLTVYSTYSQEWQNEYISNNYFDIDPVLRPENYNLGYLPWNESLFRDVPEFWASAQAHGLRFGVTQCLIAPSRAIGFLSVSTECKRKQALSDDETSLHLQLLTELSMVTLNRLDEQVQQSVEYKLSKREREILLWTAEGKTSAEIAMILSISENTVNFHQKNMQKKFNAPNKTQIACYAAATGLI